LDGRDDGRIGEHPSRSEIAATRQIIAGFPYRTHQGELASIAQSVNSGCAPPRVEARRRWGSVEHSLTFLLRPGTFAGAIKLGNQHLAEFDQQLDIERGINQPVMWQRSGRPIGGRMALLQGDSEELLEHGAERYPLRAQQSADELAIEQPA